MQFVGRERRDQLGCEISPFFGWKLHGVLEDPSCAAGHTCMIARRRLSATGGVLLEPAGVHRIRLVHADVRGRSADGTNARSRIPEQFARTLSPIARHVDCEVVAYAPTACSR